MPLKAFDLIVCLCAVALCLLSLHNQETENSVESKFLFVGHECSGHGAIYPESEEAKCVCFGCATGTSCEVIDFECEVDLGMGDPSMFHQYWAVERPEAHTVIPHFNRPLYRHCKDGMKELDVKVRAFHRRIGNVDPGLRKKDFFNHSICSFSF